MRSMKYIVLSLLIAGSLAAAGSQEKTNKAAHAKTYVLQLGEDMKAGNVALPQGTYQITVEPSKIILTPKGKAEHFEIPATISTVDKKFRSTRLSMKSENGATQLHQIDLGGTTTKIEIQ